MTKSPSEENCPPIMTVMQYVGEPDGIRPHEVQLRTSMVVGVVRRGDNFYVSAADGKEYGITNQAARVLKQMGFDL